MPINPRISLFKRPDRPYWFASYYDRIGARQKVSTGCVTKRAAELWAARREGELADPDHAAQDSATLQKAIELLLSRRAESAAAGDGAVSTVAFYQSKAGHLLRILGPDFRLRNLTAHIVDEFISTRRRETASDHTIHKELTTLRAALKLSKRAGTWGGDLDAIMPIGFSPGYKPKTRYLPPGELLALLGNLTEDHAARVAFIVATSANWSESERALSDDVAQDLSLVHLRGTKTSYRDREVPIAADWQAALLTYALEYGQGADGHVFLPWRNVRRDLIEGCKKAGIDRCSPNDLRRTTGKWLRMAGVAPHVIAQGVMGHGDSRMVERVYGRLTATDAAGLIAQVLNQLPGKAGTGRGQTGWIQPTSAELGGLCRSWNFNSYGAQGRNRTTDTRIFSPLLYRLSYLGLAMRSEGIARGRRLRQEPWGFDLTGGTAATYGPELLVTLEAPCRARSLCSL